MCSFSVNKCWEMEIRDYTFYRFCTWEVARLNQSECNHSEGPVYCWILTGVDAQKNTMDLGAHSYEVHMKRYMHTFTWNSCDLHKNLLWTSYSSFELLMNFIWNEIKFIQMKWIKSSYQLHMEFTWTSHEFHMKLNQIYSYEFTCSSYEVHMNFISKN